MNWILHIAARIMLVVGFFYLVWQPSPPPPAASTIITPTRHTDLQLARLYLKTQGVWTEADRQMLATLWQQQGQFELAARLNTPQTTHTVAHLWETIQDQVEAAQWDTAQTSLETWLTTHPDDGRAYLWLGLLLLPSQTALPHLEQAASLLGEDQALSAAILNIVQVTGYQARDVGLQLVKGAEWAWADHFFSRQIEADPFDALSYAYRGYVRDQLGQDGLADLQNAIALDPNAPLGFYMLGLHHRQQHDYDRSLQAFQDAYLLAPENPAFAAEVGGAYQLTDQLPTAEEWFKLAVSLAPEDAGFISLLAAFYADENYLLDGAGYLYVQAAADQYPENASILTSWGRVLFYRLEFALGAGIFERALSLAPNDPRTRFYYAELLERQNNDTAAIEHYFFVVQSDNPYTEAAKIGIRRVSQ